MYVYIGEATRYRALFVVSPIRHQVEFRINIELMNAADDKSWQNCQKVAKSDSETRRLIYIY